MELTKKHEDLIELLADVGDERKKEDKAIQVGFAPKYVYTLMKDLAFCQALDDATTVSVRAHRSRVYQNLLKASDSGDTTASTTFLKGAGDIVGGTQVHTVVNQSGDGKTFDERLRDNREERIEDYKRSRVVQKDLD